MTSSLESKLNQKTLNGLSQRYLFDLQFGSRWYLWLIWKQVVLKIGKKIVNGRDGFSKLMPTDLKLAYLWNFNCVRDKVGNFRKLSWLICCPLSNYQMWGRSLINSNPPAWALLCDILSRWEKVPSLPGGIGLLKPLLPRRVDISFIIWRLMVWIFFIQPLFRG